jgi:hypothetical protein
MSEATKSKVIPLNKYNQGEWDHRFFDSSPDIGTRSLPLIKAPKPYIAKNGSEVKSVLRTNAKEIKRKRKNGNRKQLSGLEVVTSTLTPIHKKQVKRTFSKGSKISALQQGRITCLRGRARPLSLPLLRDVQSPLPLGVEKSYSARDSSARTSMLKIDVSLDVDTVKEKKQWQEFKEITEDCDTDDLRHLTRLFCIGMYEFNLP